MPLPTLLRKGFIVPNPKARISASDKKRIQTMRSVDYLMEFIGDRTTRVGGASPKIVPKSPGDRVIVLKSETGSGKSTVIAPFLYENFQERTKKNIAVTQPRVLTAIDISMGLPEYYPYLKIDENLGYTTGDYKRKPKDKGIIFMTVGSLLAQLNSSEPEKFLKMYSFILIDEVHDRSIDTDMTLFNLKKILTSFYAEPGCPMVILMSATFKPETFINYFGCPQENFIQVVGSTFKIYPHFLKYDTTDFIQVAINTVQKIHIENLDDIKNDEESRDIIVFVSGGGPTKAVIEALHTFNAAVLSKSIGEAKRYIKETKPVPSIKGSIQGGADKFYIAPIELSRKTYGASGIEYRNVFSDIKNITIPIYKINKGKIDMREIDKMVRPTRRVIVATPIAETGVTIDTLRYCIDTGFVTSVSFNPDYGMTTMAIKDVTRGMATQRRGRVGRKAEGQWYPCFTEKTFGRMQEDQFADILEKDITENLCNIYVAETDAQIIPSESETIGFKKNYLTDNDRYMIAYNKPMNMSAVDFLESPSANSLIYSTEKLRILGFIDNEYKPTALGVMSKAMRKISMENKRMIFAAYAHGANVLDIITIVSFLSVGGRHIFGRRYKPINILDPKRETDWEFIYKLVIGDELIEYLLVWEYFSEYLDLYTEKARKSKKEYAFNISEVREWCGARQIKYDGILRVVTTRDEIIETLINIGMNPYYNGMGLPKGEYNLLKMLRRDLDECVSEIKKIKKCILDGYRCNLTVWDSSKRRYILKHRNAVISIRSNVMSRMGDDAVQRNAMFLILTDVMMRKNFKGDFEMESSGAVSIMDSYLDVDLDFLDN